MRFFKIGKAIVRRFDAFAAIKGINFFCAEFRLEFFECVLVTPAPPFEQTESFADDFAG